MGEGFGVIFFNTATSAILHDIAAFTITVTVTAIQLDSVCILGWVGCACLFCVCVCNNCVSTVCFSTCCCGPGRTIFQWKTIKAQLLGKATFVTIFTNIYVHFSLHYGKKNLKICLSIMIGTMICNSSHSGRLLWMHANEQENMRLGCVCAKCSRLILLYCVCSWYKEGCCCCYNP